MTPPKPPKKRYIQEAMLRPPSPSPVSTNNNSNYANNNNGDCAADGLPLSKSTKYAHTSPAPSSSQTSLPISAPPVLSSYSHGPPQGPLHAPSTAPCHSPGNGSSHAHTISRIMSANSSHSDSHRSCPAPPERSDVHPHQPGVPRRYSPTPGAANRYSPPQEDQRSYFLPPALQMTAPQNQPLSLTLSPKNSSSPCLPPQISLAPSSSSQNQQLINSPARNQDPNLMTYADERERSQLQLDRRRNDRDGLDERLVPKKNNCLKRRIIEQETQRTSAQALQEQPLNLKMVAQQGQSSPSMTEHSVGVAGIDRSYHRKKLYSQRRSSPVQSPLQPTPRQLICNEAYPSAPSACSYTPPPRSPYSSGTPLHLSPSASPSVIDYTTAQGTNHVQTGPVKSVSYSAPRYPNACSSPDIVQITKVNASDCVGRNGKRNNVPSPKSYSRSKQPKQSLHPINSDQSANNLPGDRVNAAGEESNSESAQESSPGTPQGSTRPKISSSSLPPKKSPSSPGQASPPSTASPASSPTPTDKHQEQMLIDCIIVEGIKRNTIDTEKEERNFQLFCRSQRGAEVGVVLGTNGTPPLGKINNRTLFAAVNTPTVTTGATSCSTASAVGVTSGAATGGGGVTGPTSALYSKRTSSSPSASRDA